MEFYKQLNEHNPDEGVYGDCYRTAIGCLLNIPPEFVPHFCEPHEDDLDDDLAWVDRRNLWLRDRGLRMINVYFMNPTEEDYGGRTGLDALLHQIGSWNPGMYYLLMGATVDDIDHVVICQGAQVIHNPSPREVPIVNPVVGEDFYHIAFFAPLFLDAGAAEGGVTIGEKRWPRADFLNFAYEMERESWLRTRVTNSKLDTSSWPVLKQLSLLEDRFSLLRNSFIHGAGLKDNREKAVDLGLNSLELIRELEIGLSRRTTQLTPEDESAIIREQFRTPSGDNSNTVYMTLTLDEASAIIKMRSEAKE